VRGLTTCTHGAVDGGSSPPPFTGARCTVSHAPWAREREVGSVDFLIVAADVWAVARASSQSRNATVHLCCAWVGGNAREGGREKKPALWLPTREKRGRGGMNGWREGCCAYLRNVVAFRWLRGREPHACTPVDECGQNRSHLACSDCCERELKLPLVGRLVAATVVGAGRRASLSCVFEPDIIEGTTVDSKGRRPTCAWPGRTAR
jgi:hypothetical protein